MFQNEVRYRPLPRFLARFWGKEKLPLRLRGLIYLYAATTAGSDSHRYLPQ
jgi:hypothetical protein